LRNVTYNSRKIILGLDLKVFLSLLFAGVGVVRTAGEQILTELA
jgi:hypothetical protein